MTYSESTDYLYNKLPVFQQVGASAYKANLDNTHTLDNYFDHPHTKFKTIHIAGTNGKGSVSHMLAAVLQSAGYRVGLYTSPHLIDFRERIKINGEMMPESNVIKFVEDHKSIIETVKPSFFELTVLMAFDYFAQSSVDIAVIEVGMGGRLDSTNIITPLLSVITNISFDHTQFLGDTIGKIAAEKAGIIKPGVPVVIGETVPESAVVFIGKARDEGSQILFADKIYRCVDSEIVENQQIFSISRYTDDYSFDVSVDLLGVYQCKNIVTVLTALDMLAEQGGVKISRDDVENGLRGAAHLTGLQGRWQVLQNRPLMVCDTGHNKAGLSYVVSQFSKCEYQKLYVVIGFVNDKDVDSVMPLLPTDAYYIFTQAAIERAMEANTLASIAEKYSLKGEIFQNVVSAVNRAKELATENDMIFIGGSTFVVADYFSSTVSY